MGPNKQILTKNGILANMIKIESGFDYPGPTQYEVGGKIEGVGVFIESLPRESGEKLSAFQLDHYNKHGLRGYTVYGDISLSKDYLTLVLKSPKKLPPSIITSFWGRRVAIPTSLLPSEANTILVSYSHILRQEGLKLILTHEKEEYPCTLIPPDALPSYGSLRIL